VLVNASIQQPWYLSDLHSSNGWTGAAQFLPDRKLAEFGMVQAAAALPVMAFGVGVLVRADDSMIIEQVLPFLPPGWKPCVPAIIDRVYSVVTERVGSPASGPGDVLPPLRYLFRGLRCLLETRDLRMVLEMVESDLTLFVATRSPHLLFVHAGVVEWSGAALVLPGRSHSGKTSLVSALVDAGATYYSDEYAVFDRHGLVHPFARPLSIRSAEASARTRVLVPPEKTGCKSIPVTLIVVCEYIRGAVWDPQRMDPGLALLSLLSNTVAARTCPSHAITLLGRVVSSSRAKVGARAEASQVAYALLEEIARHS
jgi:hypothetical protein